jgi:hypothetical protein
MTYQENLAKAATSQLPPKPAMKPKLNEAVGTAPCQGLIKKSRQQTIFPGHLYFPATRTSGAG